MMGIVHKVFPSIPFFALIKPIIPEIKDKEINTIQRFIRMGVYFVFVFIPTKTHRIIIIETNNKEEPINPDKKVRFFKLCSFIILFPLRVVFFHFQYFFSFEFQQLFHFIN